MMIETPSQILPDDIARQIAGIPLEGGAARRLGTPLEWALQWIASPRVLRVFPCEKWLGVPLVKKPKHWWTEATSDRSRVVEWWSEHSDADIAAVPDKSGHFVIRLIGDEGVESFAELEEQHGPIVPEFQYQTRHGDRHLWFKSTAAVSSRNRLGLGIEVIGPGRFVFLPPSLAPDYD